MTYKQKKNNRLKNKNYEYQTDKDGKTAAVRRSDRTGIADAASLRYDDERGRGHPREDLRQLGERGGKPDVLVYKEGELFKVTLFRRTGVRRRLKPQTYLLQREADGNLYMNTGFRIDVAYNEETDVLTFSPNGDYIRWTRMAPRTAKRKRNNENTDVPLNPT